MVVLNEDDYPASKFVIVCLIAWLIPRVFIDVATSLAEYEVSPELRCEGGMTRIRRSAFRIIGLATLVLAGSSAGVALGTRGLDPNMILILSGVSRIVSGGVIFVISLELPQWLGVYDYIIILKAAFTSSSRPHRKTLRTLQFDLQWKIIGQFARIYLPVQLFSCGPYPAVWGLPASYILGILMGVGFSFGVYYTRTRFQLHKARIAYTTMGIFLLLACLGFAAGSSYIGEVWVPHATINDQRVRMAVGFFVPFSLGLIIHAVAYRISSRQLQEKEDLRRSGQRVDPEYYSAHMFQPAYFAGSERKVPINQGGEDAEAHLRLTDRTNTLSLATSGSYSQDLNLEEVPIDVDGNDNDPEIVRSPSPLQLLQQSTTVESGEDSGLVVDALDDGVAETIKNDPCRDNHEDEKEASLCVLCLGKFRCCTCCCAPCGIKDRGVLSKLNSLGKVAMLLKWFFRFGMHGLALLGVIVNLGATYQGNYARELFPTVHEQLYVDQLGGPVCAFRVPFSDEDTQTFESADAALHANYTIAHCGACGHCSTWQNLELQWTTRKNLAILASRCARKILFGGEEKALNCHIETIGFDEHCSECWVETEKCAIKHCTWIQIQSSFINKLGNFAVSENVVTSAMCEEAICEVDFVPCSGANRRRMNIVSDIARPSEQQCTLAEGNDLWFDLFGPEDPPVKVRRRRRPFNGISLIDQD